MSPLTIHVRIFGKHTDIHTLFYNYVLRTLEDFILPRLNEQLGSPKDILFLCLEDKKKGL